MTKVTALPAPMLSLEVKNMMVMEMKMDMNMEMKMEMMGGRDDNDQSTQTDLWRMLLILTSSSLTHLLVPPSRCFLLAIDLHFWKSLCLEEGIVQIIQAI